MAHAALEIALDEILRTDRFDSLGELIRGEIGGLGGDPGWSLERRDPQDSWPPGAEFCASVDPAELQLPGPENYYTSAEFASRILSMLNERLALTHEQLIEVRAARSGKRAELAPLLETLEKMARGE